MLNESHCKKSRNIVRYDTAEEESCFQRQSVANCAPVVRFLQQLKAHGCLLHLHLLHSNPGARMRSPISLRTGAVHKILQRAVADSRAQIEAISIDSRLHGVPGEVL
jgi:hypothetical protein